MANGPMGGFMPTPASPAQPPSIKLETTASSRGTFSNFLKNMNGATSLNPPSMAPSMGVTSPMLAPAISNTDIFDVPQQFLSGGLVKFGQDLERGLGEPVREKINEIPQFLQVVEDSAKERFGVDLSGSSPMGGFNQFGNQLPNMSPTNLFNQLGIANAQPGDLPMFQPSGPIQEVGPKDYSMGVARPAYMPMDQDGDGIDQFGAKMPEFEANQGSPMTLSDANSAFEQGMSGLKSSAFGSGGSRIAGIGSIGSLFPVQMMQSGGEAEDFSDFGGFDDPSDPFGDSTDTSSPDSDIDYTDVFGSDELQQATDIGREASDSASDGITIASPNVKFTDLNQNQVNELRSQIANKNEVAIAEEDKFFNKDGSMNQAGKDELSKRNAEEFQLVSAGQIKPSEYLSTASDILGTGEKSVMDALNLDKPIDPFDIQPTFQNFGLPGVSGLPNVGTTRSTVAQDQARAIANLVGDKEPTIGEQLQQNVLADRGRALGPTTFGDDLANFTQNERSRGFDEISRVGDDFQTALDLVNRDEADRLAAGQAMGVGTPPLDATNITETALGARGQNVTRSTVPEDFEENVGLSFSDQRMRDIERLYNVPQGQRRTGAGDDPNTLSGIPTMLNVFENIPREQMAIDVALGRPRGLGEIVRGFTAPNIGMGQTKATDKETIEQFNQRTGRSIPEDQLVRNNTGRITAITDASGRTITGVNPDEEIFGSDDNQEPIIRKPIAPIVEEVIEEEKVPNIIGGGTPLPVPEPTSTVVASPFAPSSANINPVTFDAGELNKLIELLTGVPARPVVAKKEGGLVSAVDEFLASAS